MTSLTKAADGRAPASTADWSRRLASSCVPSALCVRQALSPRAFNSPRAHLRWHLRAPKQNYLLFVVRRKMVRKVLSLAGTPCRFMSSNSSLACDLTALVMRRANTPERTRLTTRKQQARLTAHSLPATTLSTASSLFSSRRHGAAQRDRTLSTQAQAPNTRAHPDAGSTPGRTAHTLNT